MAMTVWTPAAGDLERVAAALASWQQEGAPVQLHPGDLGWQWRFGVDALARGLRVWSRDDDLVAVGFVDVDVPAGEPAVVRMGLAPSVDRDEDVARAIVGDLEDPGAGVLPSGPAAVEARFGQALRSRLAASGWPPDMAWTPLHRVLADEVETRALRVVTVTTSEAEERVDVHRAAFAGSTFTVDRWRTMTAGVLHQQARCLVGYDTADVAVAAVTVWSAGSGRPGLLEPMGVHRDHRGRGHGVAITLAAAGALREMGSSSATVATPTSNTGGVATYLAAGFVAAPASTDFRRPA